MGGVVAAARVGVDGTGRCTVLRSAPPLTFRRTGDCLHLVGSSAGPVGGDRLRLELVVAAGGTLTIKGVAASLVHPGPRDEPSSMELVVEVAEGATLRWLPKPNVLLGGCDHTTTAWIRLAPGARLLWRDEVVLGREGESGGSLLQRLRVDVDGRPLLRNDLAVGPRHAGSLGPAGVDGARAIASVLGVGLTPVVTTVPDVRMATLRVEEGVTMVTALARSASRLARALPAQLEQLTGDRPVGG